MSQNLQKICLFTDDWVNTERVKQDTRETRIAGYWDKKRHLDSDFMDDLHAALEDLTLITDRNHE